jgi:hypothetical protein
MIARLVKLLSKTPFRAEQSDYTRFSGNGLPQCPRGRFESAFEHVMRVSSSQTICVQIALRSFRKRAPEVLS